MAFVCTARVPSSAFQRSIGNWVASWGQHLHFLYTQAHYFSKSLIIWAEERWGLGVVKEFYVRRIGCLKIRPKQIRDRRQNNFPVWVQWPQRLPYRHGGQYSFVDEVSRSKESCSFNCSRGQLTAINFGVAFCIGKYQTTSAVLAVPWFADVLQYAVALVEALGNGLVQGTVRRLGRRGLWLLFSDGRPDRKLMYQF